ncbi:Oidioi.mRNA.OKI2018_I69.PAR.g9517.t1.cds [Oikopleura dioica]|uniref:Mitochondrial pyruvate carrier n=1 Tax=Oikopleura dioica TaxID=34765 RepID=A0ABN7RL26_OIKDI|nr:Oidioi.mRNA.OKI2018_I69.PAR.g9517.t1.cds [Oikopleura dioica]
MSGAYRRFIGVLDGFVNAKFPSGKINEMWHHPAGPKTIFFWAPTWKWSLVIAGLADLARPSHQLSLNGSLALVANGTIYTRWYYWAITPRNAVGASCSFFTALTGVMQAGRRLHYDYYVKGTPEDPALVEAKLD